MKEDWITQDPYLLGVQTKRKTIARMHVLVVAKTTLLNDGVVQINERRDGSGDA
jgi:hypothetical protein